MSEVDSEFGGGTSDLLVLAILNNINNSINNQINKSINVIVHGFNKLITRTEQLIKTVEHLIQVTTRAAQMSWTSISNKLEADRAEYDKHADRYRELIKATLGKLTETPTDQEGIGTGEGASMFVSTLKLLALRVVLKGINSITNLIKQVIQIGKSPVTELFGDSLSRLIKIINTVLKPLEPFFFLLELIATVLEAILTPITIELWEEFDEIFDELVAMIPDLTTMVETWIEDDYKLADTIDDIINGILNLISAFVTGDLLKNLYDMSTNLILLAAALVIADKDGVTLIERFIKLAFAITNLAVSLIPLLGVIEWIVEALTKLTDFATTIATGWEEFWTPIFNLPPSIQQFQEGGEIPYTGLIFAHEGETVHKTGIDDEMLSELEMLNRNIKKLIQLTEDEMM